MDRVGKGRSLPASVAALTAVGDFLSGRNRVRTCSAPGGRRTSGSATPLASLWARCRARAGCTSFAGG